MDLISTFLLGFLLSFLGQLPLGTLSLTATQIAVQENFRNAWKYAFGVAFIEWIYLRLVLTGIDWVTGQHLFFQVLQWITVFFFLILGIAGLIKSGRPEQKALLLNNTVNRFALGAGMSLINPAQIPFWIIWSGYFISQHWLKTQTRYFNIFSIGSAFGTIGGLAVYMYGGNYLIKKMKTSNRMLNKITGFVFIVAGLVQLYGILFT